MTRTFYPIIGMLVLVLALASCSSTKTLKKVSSIEGMTGMEYVEQVLQNAGGRDVLTAKMALTLRPGSKNATKVNGTLRIKKGEVVQLSVAPLLGIEVARVEISPDGMLVIDRMNKRYVQVSFAEVKALTHTDLDFHTLQALFLNELFLPGKKTLDTRNASAFRVEPGVQGVALELKKSKRFSYRFLTQAPEAWLTESCIGLTGTPYQLKWRYGNFRAWEQKHFPALMNVSFEGAKKPMEVAIALSRLSADSDWETHTEVSRKYEKVELEDILKLLLK